MQETNNNILITGKSLDDQSLSRFMKLLEKSAYFTNIDYPINLTKLYSIFYF